MNNQTFLQEIEELLHGDTVIMIQNYKGATWTLEGEGDIDLDRAIVYRHTQGKYHEDVKLPMVAFNMRDFIDECDRLEFNYEDMLKTMVNMIIYKAQILANKIQWCSI